MSLHSALTALSQVTVAGVQQHYGMDRVPQHPARAQLPALLVLPLDTEDHALLRQRGRAFDQISFSGAIRTVEVRITHLLLVAPVNAGSGLRAHLPPLVTLMDAYFEALAADVTLGDTLAAPAQVEVETGVFTVGDSAFYGCAFRHRWLLTITPTGESAL